jgi:hypothetical protein
MKIYDVFVNEVRLKDEVFLECEKMVNLQTQGSRNSKMNKKNLKKLHVQRILWRGNSKTSLCWAFYCVNDNKKVNATTHQTMLVLRCICTHLQCYHMGL